KIEDCAFGLGNVPCGDDLSPAGPALRAATVQIMFLLWTAPHCQVRRQDQTCPGLSFFILPWALEQELGAPEEVEQFSGLTTPGVIPRPSCEQALVAGLKDSRSSVAEV